MIPSLPTPPGAEMAEAFMGALMAALEGKCECEPCEILRATSRTFRERLLRPRA